MIEQEFHAAISAEKPTTINPSAPSQQSSQPPPPLSQHTHVHSMASEGKRTDAELGEQVPSTVCTQKIGRINDIEILETSFGVSERACVYCILFAACVSYLQCVFVFLFT